MQNVKLLIATLVGTLVLIFGIGFFLSQDFSGATQEVSDQSQLVTETPHLKGATESARFTLVEFSDFQCPACAATEPQIASILEEYPDVAFVYRHYPLRTIHPNAESSAWASEAAAMQGKFWEMHDALFARQAEWSELTDASEYYLGLAVELGLDGEQFEDDYVGQAVKERVAEDLRAAEQLRLNSTPTFFLDGQKMSITQVRNTLQQNY
ncbi:DsbA family protein [Candidatus Woesebacteria bacterium]|nr:DsbA family protein [Candidatus Woesebacteria bacterium]MCD8506941.1 DsbA family protein [Candidatus Woesebacteria bacterium]MCD8527231.1 DsbA family protein [Candidatus Woesebacteria bacterium]MCD8546597.1 DsbA family protein [Candidatus Woesebacteria bacterium]